VRLLGTTIQTGWKGVLFRFGRAVRELEPGFHALIPLVHHVRKTPVRSITLELPRQRVTTADGLVYDIEANLVYRVVEPIKAMVEIDNLRKGCEAVLTLIVQDLLRGQTRGGLLERQSLDEEFAAQAEKLLSRWGVAVEQAGFTTIAPTRETLRLTQLALLARERQLVLDCYTAEGLSPELAVGLLGSEQQLVSRAAARYHTPRPPRSWALLRVPRLTEAPAEHLFTWGPVAVTVKREPQPVLDPTPLANKRRRRFAPRRRYRPLSPAVVQSMLSGSTSTVNSTPEGALNDGSTERST